MSLLYVIIYTVAFILVSSSYILLYSIKRQEFFSSAEKIQKIPITIIRLLKIIPTIFALFFVIFSAPELNKFYILLAIAFFFCLLGDFGIILNVFLGLGLFFMAHVFFFVTYLTQIITFSFHQLVTNGTFIALAILVVILVVIGILISLYLNPTIMKNQSKPWKIKLALFSYLSILFLHVITSFIITYNYLRINPGIIVVFIGCLIFLFSDFMISIREFHHKQKYSVLLIMSTYYSALLLISLVTLFYQTS
ncbi:MAG TPA: lysoplasmalogenase family protein [Candidatus Bathyarchaeia archaeon]|nr:lysoplasmalogenase family protein [Candidatus Bathyarchaeia archaeon]